MISAKLLKREGFNKAEGLPKFSMPPTAALKILVGRWQGFALHPEINARVG
jgi:hypothetical protein